MGISRGTIRLLGMALGGARRAGSVVTFGVQKIGATRAEAVAALAASGIEPAHPAAGGDGRLHQEELFRMLGYSTVESIDVYDAERPTHVLDLNRPLPPPLLGRFDLVYDGGTTEHCFSVPDVLGNATRLLKTGGRIIHHLPLNNWVDHGFYQFSPTLFFDFYAANGFAEPALTLHFSRRGRDSYIAYDPQADGNVPYALGGDSQVMGFFTAIKRESVQPPAYPIQGRYRRAFGGEHAAPQGAGWLARLKRSLKKRSFRLRAKRC
jgi:SAM-dependent methyltransferase